MQFFPFIIEPVVREGPFKHDFGGGLAVVGCDASYSGVLTASHVKDWLLLVVLHYLQENGAWSKLL